MTLKPFDSYDKRVWQNGPCLVISHGLTYLYIALAVHICNLALQSLYYKSVCRTYVRTLTKRTLHTYLASNKGDLSLFVLQKPVNELTVHGYPLTVVCD